METLSPDEVITPVFLLQRLVVKPDQLIKRRGKLGLVGVNLDLNGVKNWLKPRLNKEATVCFPSSALHQRPLSYSA